MDTKCYMCTAFFSIDTWRILCLLNIYKSLQDKLDM